MSDATERPQTGKPLLPVRPLRTTPALRPAYAPWTATVVVVDTNVLATSACYAAKGGPAPLLNRIGMTGRANLFAGTHVPGEMDEHLERIAVDMHVPLDAARQEWHEHIAPAVRLAELPIGEHLRPEIAGIRRYDPALPKAQRGDPDDLPTAALAAFLGPAVIVTADTVFARFGLAAVNEWVPVAQNLLAVAGYEANYADTVFGAELTVRALAEGGRAAWQLLQRYPLAGAGLAGALLFAVRSGRLDPAPVRAAAWRLGERAQPILERLVEASARHASGRAAMVTVNDRPWRTQTLTELCARLLARTPTALPASALRDALAAQGIQTSAAECRRNMLAHPAFQQLPGDKFTLGRPIEP